MKVLRFLFTGIVSLSFSFTSFSQTEAVSNPNQSSASPQSDQSLYSEPPRSPGNLRDRIYFGGYFGLQFGTFTSVDISPLVGYRITPDFNVGVGVLYNYTEFDYGPPIGRRGYSSWGGRINTNYTLFNLVTLGAEYQYRSVEVYDVLDAEFFNQGVNVLFLGGGIRQQMGRNAFLFIMVYYDVLQEQYSPYNSVVYRFGVAAGL